MEKNKMNEKQALLDKYSIPIEHLDFDYIKTCQNFDELEKMLEILKSGEEGYYPDLTKFAEEKLKELDPNNRMLRIEVKCLPTGTNERQQINEFVRIIKDKDRKIRIETSSLDDDGDDEQLPPVRTIMAPLEVIDELNAVKTSNSKRIPSSDYNQWDKYDADTECLKIDLHEEQIRERSYAEQRKQQKKQPKLIEILSEETTNDNIGDVEKHELADNHRIKGNESFKCAEYQLAILEYSKSLSYVAVAAVFNNRAIAYLKLKMYSEAISDCDKCLQIEPTNVKAILRKCEALVACDRKNDAYRLYMSLLQIDPDNATAKKALKNMSIRLEIEDLNVQQSNFSIPCIEKLELNDTHDGDNDDGHLFDGLIIPKRNLA